MRRTPRALADELAARLSDDPRVLGLVLLGSLAEPDRLDDWSDVDFYVVTEPGAQEAFRQDLAWLPHSEEIAGWARETEHGLKVLYQDGLLLEFAVFDRLELSRCASNHYLVALDRADIAALMAAGRERSLQPRAIDAERAAHLFLDCLLIGVGRYRRGERIAGWRHVGEFAVGHLVDALVATAPDSDPESALDALDPRRRLEQAYPEAAGAIASALDCDLEACARALLRLAHERWADAGWYPVGAHDAVALRLGYSGAAPMS